jgi:hypothetical protein
MYRDCGSGGTLEGRPGDVSPQNLLDPFWRGRWCDRDWCDVRPCGTWPLEAYRRVLSKMYGTEDVHHDDVAAATVPPRQVPRQPLQHTASHRLPGGASASGVAP